MIDFFRNFCKAASFSSFLILSTYITDSFINIIRIKTILEIKAGKVDHWFSGPFMRGTDYINKSDYLLVRH